MGPKVQSAVTLPPLPQAFISVSLSLHNGRDWAWLSGHVCVTGSDNGNTVALPSGRGAYSSSCRIGAEIWGGKATWSISHFSPGSMALCVVRKPGCLDLSLEFRLTKVTMDPSLCLCWSKSPSFPSGLGSVAVLHCEFLTGIGGCTWWFFVLLQIPNPHHTSLGLCEKSAAMRGKKAIRGESENIFWIQSIWGKGSQPRV